MERYYRVLGISQGASQSEIKKAYFKLVRQYSPEKNPEQFREIREAYEYLKNAQEETGPSFPEPQDPWAVVFLKQIQEYAQHGKFSMFRDACQEAFKAFPEEIQFEYLLAVAQRKAGNTGKAVKTGEALVKKDPQNKWYQRELALAYIERGYTKKAIPVIVKAFEMGCRDNDFLLTASITCNEQDEMETCWELLMALVKKEKRWGRDDIPDVLEAYIGLCTIGMDCDIDMGEVLGLLKQFLEQYPLYLEENMDILLQVLMAVALLPWDVSSQEAKLEEMIQILQRACHSKENIEMISSFIEGRKLYSFMKDERFGDTLAYGISSYYDGEIDNEIRRYAILDMKLCMLKERGEILPQLDILEKEYAVFYEKISDFAAKLRSDANLENMKDALQRQYASLEQYMSGGRYFELYPEEKIRSFGRVIYQNDESQPYVRGEKKIGRNNPCPCGSGKKYKKCCGMGKI